MNTKQSQASRPESQQVRNANSGLPARRPAGLLCILSLCLSLWTGCATTSNDRTAIERIGNVAELAAYTGAALHLVDHPEGAGRIGLAINALDNLASTNGFNAIALSQALSQLPIKELSGEKGHILIGAAVLLYEAELSQLTPIEQPPYVQAVATRVRAGLYRALQQFIAQAVSRQLNQNLKP